MLEFVKKSPCCNMKRVALIDGDNLAWQVFFGIGAALKFRGQRTDISYGFLRKILLIAEDLNTKNLVFCWDSRESIRKRISPSYKRRRSANDDPQKLANRKEVAKQIKFIREEILPGLGFNNSFLIEGYEADDIMAALALIESGSFNFIASTDDDMIQCLNLFCAIYNLKKRKIFSYEHFQKRYGRISPWYWGEAKAIGGCNSDGVKGVPGVADPAKSKMAGVPLAIQYLTGEMASGKKYEKIRSAEMQRRISKNRLLVHLPFRAKFKNDYLDFYRQHLKISDDSLSLEKASRVFGKYAFHSFLRKETFEKWGQIFCGKTLNRCEEASSRAIIKRGDMRSKRKTAMTEFLR